MISGSDLAMLRWPILAMGVVVLASNVLVLHPFTPFGLGDYLTWGAFTYPAAFLVIDVANRRFGAAATRKLVVIGFAFGLALTSLFSLPPIGWSTPRIAVASGAAFLVAQMIDVAIFDRLRARVWWVPALVSSLVSSAVDTALFFSIAFAGDPAMSGPVPLAGVEVALWQSLAVFDFAVKLALTVLFLAPYGAILSALGLLAPIGPSASASRN
jgi:uncharacterized integral membrane protein (TIGR00697 family)